MTQIAYTRVSGKRRRVTGSSQLWLGSDHLLLADTTWFVQRYRRFRLSEIQALVVSRRPPRYALRALLLAATLLLLAASVRGAAGSRFWNITAILVWGAALLFQVRALAGGPPCRAVLRTAVTSVPLSAVGRMREAEAFLGAVTPAIEAAQASLAPLPESPVESAAAASIPSPPAVPPARINWALYYILFAGVTLSAGISFFSFLWTLNEAASLVWTLTVLTIVLGVYLLASHRGAWIPPRLLCLLCTVTVTADMLITIYAMAQNLAAAAAGPRTDPVSLTERLSRWPGWFLRYSLIENPLMALAGLAGLLVTDVHARRGRKRSARMENIT